MRKRRYQSTIRHAFVSFAFFNLALIVGIILCFFAFYFYKTTVIQSRSSGQKVLTMLKDMEQQSVTVFDQLIQDPLWIQALVERDQQEGAGGYRGVGEPDEPEVVQALYQRVYQVLPEAPTGSSLLILGSKNQLLASTLYQPETEQFNASALHSLLLRKVERGAQPQGVLYLRQIEQPFLDYWAVYWKRLESGQTLLLLLQPVFWDSLPSSQRSSPIIVCDGYHNLLFANQGARIEQQVGERYPHTKWSYPTESEKVLTIHQETYFVSPCAERNWRIYVLTPLNPSFHLLAISLLLLLLLLPLLFLLSRHFARRQELLLQQPLDQLLASAALWKQGKRDPAGAPIIFEEFQMVSDAYDQLLTELEATTHKNIQLVERKRMLEVKQLKSQFHPHFLFNVLEAIRYQILLSPESASEMVVKLAGLLRYSIHSGKQLVDLRTDLAHIQDYLALQKMRYGERLTYQIDFPETILDIQIPKLLIQPLVENSLLHGMNHHVSIHLALTARETAEGIEIQVRDDGDGMDSESLLRLQKQIQRDGAVSFPQDPQAHHIGLVYVHQMIQLLYGSSYGIRLASEPDKGFCVRVFLPSKRNTAGESDAASRLFDWRIQ